MKNVIFYATAQINKATNLSYLFIGQQGNRGNPGFGATLGVADGWRSTGMV